MAEHMECMVTGYHQTSWEPSTSCEAISISDALFIEVTSTELFGGAISVNSIDTRLIQSTFITCTCSGSTSYGGAVHFYDLVCQSRRNCFYDCIATTHGMAFRFSTCGTASDPIVSKMVTIVQCGTTTRHGIGETMSFYGSLSVQCTHTNQSGCVPKYACIIMFHPNAGLLQWGTFADNGDGNHYGCGIGNSALNVAVEVKSVNIIDNEATAFFQFGQFGTKSLSSIVSRGNSFSSFGDGIGATFTNCYFKETGITLNSMFTGCKIGFSTDDITMQLQNLRQCKFTDEKVILRARPLHILLQPLFLS